MPACTPFTNSKGITVTQKAFDPSHIYRAALFDQSRNNPHALRDWLKRSKPAKSVRELRAEARAAKAQP